VNAKLPGGSLVRKRSIVVGGKHKTSIALEDAFWNAFKEIAASKKILLNDLATQINNGRQHKNLSSAIRVFVLDHYRGMAEHKSE